MGRAFLLEMQHLSLHLLLRRRLSRRTVTQAVAPQTPAQPLRKVARISSDRLPIFLMHVPKCAGTSVYRYLRPSFDESEVCPPPSHGVWDWLPRDVPGYKLYCGHFSADFLKQMRPGGTRLIVMRHPLSRVVSLYDFWRSYRWEYIRSHLPPPPKNGPAIAKAGDLGSFLGTDSEFAIEQIYNPVARQLVGSRYQELWPDEDAIIAASIAELQALDWIGVAESFETSFRLLNRVFDLPIPAVIPRELLTYDVRPDDPTREVVAKSQPTDEESQRIIRGNRVDMDIYRKGRKILEDRARTIEMM